MKDNIIVALDVNTIKEAERLLGILSPHIKIFKVGMEAFYSCGRKIIEIIKKHDREIFLDLKFHDIPNTVKNAGKAAARMDVFMFNVHALGGKDMMKAAVEGAGEESERLGIDRPRILGVTVLTSMDNKSLQEIGINKSPEDEVLDLSRLVDLSGLDGVVASPKEIESIRKNLRKEFLIVTPGVRPEGSSVGDQKRIATPKQALTDGADYLVIGRPITKAKDPLKALKLIGDVSLGDRLD